MVSRRGFLRFSGVGMLTLSAGCQPPGLQSSLNADDLSTGFQSLAQKLRHKGLKNRLLGYPINMNTPSEEFFKWHAELLQAGSGSFAFNNVGNPFRKSPILFNTHELEREVIKEFGKLSAFPLDDIGGCMR